MIVFRPPDDGVGVFGFDVAEPHARVPPRRRRRCRPGGAAAAANRRRRARQSVQTIASTCSDGRPTQDAARVDVDDEQRAVAETKHSGDATCASVNPRPPAPGRSTRARRASASAARRVHVVEFGDEQAAVCAADRQPSALVEKAHEQRDIWRRGGDEPARVAAVAITSFSSTVTSQAPPSPWLTTIARTTPLRAACSRLRDECAHPNGSTASWPTRTSRAAKICANRSESPARSGWCLGRAPVCRFAPDGRRTGASPRTDRACSARPRIRADRRSARARRSR